MLETLAVLFIVVWAVGLVSSFAIGNLVHIMLVLSIVTILIRVMTSRRL
ncbi:MAG: lmo0937 family membrane protein [Gammaproteobacteria bacterium]|nr:MAG: lmo0937 family membrane protein [Gammaproteobacteria bacterium]